MQDVVIRNGEIVDGEGGPRFRADVAIQGGRIREIGRVSERGAREIDASGCVVSPGFIDPHTHYDGQLTWDPRATCSSWHGVTSVIIGNCGFGFAPCKAADRDKIMRMMMRVEGMSLGAMSSGIRWEFETLPEYMRALERRGAGVNVGVLLGHSLLRQFVMGDAAWQRAASADELAAMQGMFREALDEGALGLSTSVTTSHVGMDGAPVPSRSATLEEMAALAGELSGRDRGVVQISMHTAAGAADEAALVERIAAASGRPVIVGSIRHDAGYPDRHREALAQIGALWGRGHQVHAQVSPLPLTLDFSILDAYLFNKFPVWGEVLSQPADRVASVLAQPGFRDRFLACMSDLKRDYLLSERGIRVLSAAREPLKRFEGQSIFEIAGRSRRRPVDAFFDLALEDDLRTTFDISVLNTEEDAVAEILRAPHTLISSSDAGAHVTLFCQAGQTSHVLGHWVRERGLFSLEEAVRLMTSAPADVFGIRDRGRVRVGLAADLVVFDPDQIADGPAERVHDMPDGSSRLVTRPRGVRWSLVNGRPVVEEGTPRADLEGDLPGAVLRPAGRA